jgi:hypothetical protein
MRWLVTLQVALGFAALFGLAYTSVDGVVGPVTQVYAGSAAEAEARSATAELLVAWSSALDAQGRVVRTLAQGEVFSRVSPTEAEPRGLALALEAAVAEVGGVGRAALLKPDGGPVVDSAGVTELAGTEAAQAALTGVSSARLERVDGAPTLVTASPITSGGALAGVLVLSTPVDVRRLRGWTETLPPGVAVALVLDGHSLFNTLPGGEVELASDVGGRVKVGREDYAVIRRGLPGGGKVEALGLAMVRSEGAKAAVGHVQLLVLVLGGLSLLLVVVVLGLSPLSAPVPAEAEEPEARPGEVPIPPLASAPPALDPHLSFPSAPPPPAVDPVMAKQFAQKTLPAHPAPAQPVPVPAPMPPVAAPAAPFNIPSASTDLKTPLGGERSPFAKGVPVPVPAPAPVPGPTFAEPAAPLFPPPAPPSPPAPVVAATPSPRMGGSAISLGAGAVPAPSPAPRPTAPPSAFDAIADAARSRPPPPGLAPLPPASSGEDLPAPKGGVPPELMARERAQAQREAMSRAAAPADPRAPRSSPYDPELPAPKGPDAQHLSGELPSPATEPPRQPPGPTLPPALAIPLPGTASGAHQNPWQNPSVPSMRAPTAPPFGHSVPPTTAPPGPADVAPYDEAHYRMVYNEFVASKAQLGEAVDSITYEGFRSKLRSSEEQLLGRHGCRAVRFQVLVKDRTVSLRPQLVR